MKRIISLILILSIASCGWPIFTYAEELEKYLTIPVEYSDNIGNSEQLEIMVKDGCVYANAEMLAERLGYSFGKEEESIVIYNTGNEEIPIGFTQFSLNDTKVSHMIYSQMADNYEAPFPSMENEKGYWIPLEYSLLILNSGLMIGDTALSIDMPHKDIIDYLYDIQKNGSTYRFDWNKDFGYTDLDVNMIGGSSHLINIFNGLLDLDGDSWAAMFQSFVMDSSAYDEKYGQNLASLLCAESQGELDASIDEIELLMDLFDEDGQLGQILSDYSLNLDTEVGLLYQNCEKILQDVQADNSSVVNYNRSYQALEKALDKQTWFSDTGGTILDVQKKLSDATSVLDVGLKVYEAVEFFHEFTNQDKFSLSALNDYLDTSVSTAVMSADMKKSMTEYSQALADGLGDFMCKNLKDRIPSWITQGLPLGKIIGSQGGTALFAWDIVSSVVPPISNGLEGADKFELALYAQTFQSDTLLNYQRLRDTIFANVDDLSTDQLYKLSQYAYIYLKSCYVTRNAALGSLEGKRESVQEQIQPLINAQNDINADIARMLVLLKASDTTNEANVYGFLPADNMEYLAEVNNSKLTVWAESIETETFVQLPSEFIFSSGAGGWATIINLNQDGTFTGRYQDSNYLGETGNEWEYIINDFSGKFTMLKQIDDYVYSMKLEYLNPEGTAGEYTENNIKYIIDNSVPYGFEEADEFMIYLPGCPLDIIPEDFFFWTVTYVNKDEDKAMPEGIYGIYNVGGMCSFIGKKE